MTGVPLTVLSTEVDDTGIKVHGVTAFGPAEALRGAEVHTCLYFRPLLEVAQYAIEDGLAKRQHSLIMAIDPSTVNLEAYLCRTIA